MANASPGRSTAARADLNEILGGKAVTKASSRAKTVATEKDARFANIQANAFFQIVFAEDVTPEQKREAIAKALTAQGTREENRARIKEFELFKEYLQHVREEMAQEIIKLTDTEAFSELKRVYDELNNSLIGFEDKMQPLTDILDALYQLRASGLTYDAFKEIQADRAREEERQKTLDSLTGQTADIKDRVQTLQRENAMLSEQKSFFGFGGVTKSAREQIALNELAISQEMARLGEIETTASTVRAEAASASSLGEFSAQKAKLRELLDITTDEHKHRQEALVTAAYEFINTAKTRVGAVRDHLGHMNNQIEGLFDANNHMTTVYAIMNEGIRSAEGENQKIRETLEPAESEDLIAKMTRENKRMDVEQHITMLNASAADTMVTYTDLTSQGIRIKTMKDANDSQITKARDMHGRGIAGVADRLSTVLQAVSSAAIGESSAMAKDTLHRMSQNTNTIAQKESIRVAMGVTEQNDDLTKAIDDLDAYGAVMRSATDITREGLSEMRDKLDEMKNLAAAVQGDLHDAIAVAADVAAGKSGKTAEAAPAAAAPFFKFGGN